MRILKRTLCFVAGAAALAAPFALGTASAGSIWQPTADSSISWNWQLQGTPNLSNHVQMYDIDGFDNTAATVSALHAQGTIAVCYIDLGTWENWRSDAGSFPSSVLGSSNGWPGEKWLDIRQISTLAPIMTARMQMCVQKGFDALEPDNIDGYSNSTGFPLSAQDQLNYNEWIANTAHSLGLSVGLKNDVDQTSQLEPYFDWALDEQCNQYSECNTEKVFTDADKAVFNAEYGSSTSFCAADIAAHINGVRFSVNLDGSTYAPCGGWSGTGSTTTTASTTSSSTSTTGNPGSSSSSSSSTSSSSTSSSSTSTTQATTTTTRRTTTTTSPRRSATTSTTTPSRRRRSSNGSQRFGSSSSGSGSGFGSNAVSSTTSTVPWWRHHRSFW